MSIFIGGGISVFIQEEGIQLLVNALNCIWQKCCFWQETGSQSELPAPPPPVWETSPRTWGEEPISTDSVHLQAVRHAMSMASVHTSTDIWKTKMKHVQTLCQMSVCKQSEISYFLLQNC